MNRIMTPQRQHALAHGTPAGQALIGCTRFNARQDIADQMVIATAHKIWRVAFTVGDAHDSLAHVFGSGKPLIP